jgi:hypothetical protein
MFGDVLIDHYYRVLELINGYNDQVMETWNFGVQSRPQTCQKEQNVEKVKYIRFKCLNMLHTPFSMHMVLWFAL